MILEGIIDFDRLMNLLGFYNYDDLKNTHSRWVDSELQNENHNKENKWTQSIAVGSKTIIEKIKKALGYRTKGRKIISTDDTYVLREALAPFGNADNLDSGITYSPNQPIGRFRIYRQPPTLIGQFFMKIDRLRTKYWCFQESLAYFSISCCGPTPGLVIMNHSGIPPLMLWPTKAWSQTLKAVPVYEIFLS